MTYPEWLDLVAKGIVPALTGGATVAALIFTNRNFARTLRQQQDAAARQHDKERRAEIEAEKERRREAFAKLATATETMVLAASDYCLASKTQVGSMALYSQGQLLKEHLPPYGEAVSTSVSAYKKAAQEYSHAMNVFRALFPLAEIAPALATLDGFVRATMLKAGATKGQCSIDMEEGARLMKQWVADQILIIQNTGNVPAPKH